MTRNRQSTLVPLLAGFACLAVITGCSLKPTIYYLPAPTLPAPVVSTSAPSDVEEHAMEEQPVEKHAVEQEPVDEHAVEEQPVEEHPVEEQPVDEHAVDEPQAALQTGSLAEGTYSADFPGITYSGADWTVTSDSAVSSVLNSMAMFQVNLPEPGVVVLRYRPSAEYGRMQVQIDNDAPEPPIDMGAAAMEPSLYWVSSTLDPGLHTVYLSSLDGRPVNLMQVGVAAVLDQTVRLHDETEPGILKFGEWNDMDYPGKAQGDSAIASRPDSGAIIIVFEQNSSKPVSVRLVAENTAGTAIFDMDGKVMEMPYKSNSGSRLNIIGLANLSYGRHVLKITGDGSGHIVRFDGFEFTTTEEVEVIPPDLSDKVPTKTH